MQNEDTSLIPYEATYTAVEMVRPIIDPRAAAEAMRQYEALKAAIVQQSDIHTETRKSKDEKGNWVTKEVKYLKKSYWRRIARCFGLTLEPVSEQRGFDEANNLYYSAMYRAVAPNGQSMVGDGYCSRAEGGHGYWPEHSVRATAHTRAKNRAISDLVGGGEVSAEEMPGGDAYIAGEAEHKALPAPAAQPARKPAPPTATATPANTPAIKETFEALKERAAGVGVRGNDWTALAQQRGGTSDPTRITAPGLKNLERHISGLEGAKAQAAAKLTRPADAPAPSADEMAAGQADYDANRDDFPPVDNDIDLSKLPMGAMPS